MTMNMTTNLLTKDLRARNGARALKNGIVQVWDKLLEHNQIAFKTALACGAVLVALASVALLCGTVFVRPVQDDVDAWVTTRQMGTLDFVHRLYLSWSGRWAWGALLDVVLRATNGDLRFLVGAMVLAGGAVWAWAFGRRAVAIYASALVAAVSQTPGFGQAIYWFSAATNILPTLLFFPLLLVIRRAAPSRTNAGLAFVTALVLCSFHEGSALALVVVAACGVAYLWVTQRKARASDIASLAGAIIGLAIMAIAPGNAARLTTFPGTGHLPASRSIQLGIGEASAMLRSALPVPSAHFPSWLDTPQIWLAWNGALVFWAFMFAATLSHKGAPRARAFRWQRPALIAALGASCCTLVFVASALGIKQTFVTYERIFFVPAFIVALTASALGYSLRHLVAAPRARAVFSVLALCAVPSSIAAVRSMANEARAMREFARDYDARAASFAHLQNRDVVAKAPVPPFAGVKLWSPTTDGYMSADAAQFYGLKSLRAP